MIIGLTGGIASGKTLVAAELKRLGAYIIDADEIARALVVPGLPTYEDIVKEFGNGILNIDKTINRKALGKLVFSNPKFLNKLNQITHPVILDEISRTINVIKDKYTGVMIVIDAALLIEVGFYKQIDKVIVVYTDEKTQINRLVMRDNLTVEEAMGRIVSQMPLNEKLKYADFVINNIKGKQKEEIKVEVNKIFEILTRKPI